MQVIATKTVTGIHSLTGKSLRYTVEAVLNPEAAVDRGRWIVRINGKACRWYGMESSALGCVRRAKVGAYGITFGEAF